MLTIGALVPFLKFNGDLNFLISSQRFSFINVCNVFAPPSTIAEIIFLLYKSLMIWLPIGFLKSIISLDIIIFSALELKTFELLFKLLSLLIITTIGSLPSQSLVVSLGLSSEIVFLPTIKHCSSYLHLWTSCREYLFDIQTGFISFFVLGAIKPSLVSAHFKII